ncbi:M81 family metallopeptidase, partial [Rhizobium ruizarguesonis]
AEDLWRMTVETREGRSKPDMAVFDGKMIDVFPTSREPRRSFVDKIMQIETEDPDILSISVIHGFMVGDGPEMGTKLLVVT